jgi:uncharacterized protein YuzE
MKKEFIPYDQALELKELGFDDECLLQYSLTYDEDDKTIGVELFNASDCFVTSTIKAPLYQQAFRWFRNQVSPQIVINEKGDSVQGMLSLLPLVYLNNYEIQVIKESIYHTLDNFSGAEIPSYQAAHIFNGYTVPTYEEAELACLKKLIEIVKNK